MVNQIITTRKVGNYIPYVELSLGGVVIGNYYGHDASSKNWRLCDFWTGHTVLVNSNQEAIDHFSRPFPASEDAYTVIRTFQSLEREVLTAIANKDRETAVIYLSRLKEFNSEKAKRHGNLYGDLGLPAMFLNVQNTFANHFGTSECPVDLITQLARDSERFKLLLA
jgi:uncharacterized protein (DUF2384 family)